MGYSSKYNRRRRAAKRLQKRLAIAALLCATVSAAAFMTLREQAPEAPGAYAGAGAALARPVAATVAAMDAPSAHAGARRVYPFSIVPGGVSGREEVVRMLQTDQVVAQHYAGLQAARLARVTVSKPRAVYVSYRKGDKVYWTAQKVTLAKGETLLTDGSNEIRGRCGNRISDTARLPVEANGPTMAMLDAATDPDADEAADRGRHASASSSDTSTDADGASGAVQLRFLAGYASGSGAAPGDARAPMLPATSGVGGAAAPSRPTLSATPTTTLSAQTGVGGDSGVSSGTPGLGGTGGSGGTGGTGGTSGAPPKTTPPPGGGVPPAGAPGNELPHLPTPPYGPGSPPVIIGKAPPKNNQVPEPDSLWLSGVALAAMVLVRRKARRGRQG